VRGDRDQTTLAAAQVLGVMERDVGF
jgi:hypothetical protein